MRGGRARSRTRVSLLIATGLCCTTLLSACGSKGTNATTASTTAASATTRGTATGQATPSHVVSAKATPSHVVSAHVVNATSGTVAATMTAAGHSPRVGVPWPISFAVKSNDKPVKAEVRYEYLFGGQVVARRSHYQFTGGFRDTFKWPATAVGYPLTFRAVILAEGTTLNLDYPVQVRR